MDDQSLPPADRKKFYQGKASALRRRAEAEPIGRFKDHLFKHASEYDLLAAGIQAASAEYPGRGR
jgi:hypothetical protein